MEKLISGFENTIENIESVLVERENTK